MDEVDLERQRRIHDVLNNCKNELLTISKNDQYIVLTRLAKEWEHSTASSTTTDFERGDTS